MSQLSLILLLSLFAVAFGAPAFESPSVIRQRVINDGSGIYEYFYELANGQFFAEKGYLKEDGSQVKEGGYSYTDTNGNTQSTSYTADDSGFHPIVGIGKSVLYSLTSNS